MSMGKILVSIIMLRGVHEWIRLRNLLATIVGLYFRSTDKAVTQQTQINEVKIPFALSEQTGRFH